MPERAPADSEVQDAGAIEVTFTRHAESTSNVSGRWQGHGDAPLSEPGREQARAWAAWIGATSFDRVVASDLSRTTDTARALTHALELDETWREIDVGAWEGLTREEVGVHFAGEIEALKAGEPIKIGGGESWRDLYVRIDGALESLRQSLPAGSKNLVVSHGGVISSLFAGFLGVRQKHPRPIGRVANTGTSTVRFAGPWTEIVRFNDTGHLHPVGPWARERRVLDDTLVTLIAIGGTSADVGDPGGRSRGGALAQAERVAAFYDCLDHVYATRAPGARDFAAVIAGRLETPLEDGLDTSTLDAVGVALRERHGAARVGLVVDAAQLAAYATRHACHREGTRFAPADHGSVTHLVVSDEARTFADYNVAPRKL